MKDFALETFSKYRRLGCAAQVVVGFLALCLCMTVVGLIQSTVEETGQAIGVLPTETPTPTPTNTPVPTNTPTPEPTSTPAPTNTPAPTATPAPPTATPGPREMFERVIRSVLGNSNRGVERVQSISFEDGAIIVEWSINDNLTAGLLKYGAQSDIKDILEVVAGHSRWLEYDHVIVVGYFSMRDKLGNVEESQVVRAAYPRETVEAINFENFLAEDVYDIASGGTVHPEFRD